MHLQTLASVVTVKVAKYVPSLACDTCFDHALLYHSYRTKVKCRVETIDGTWVEKIPAWIRWVTLSSGMRCCVMPLYCTVDSRPRSGAKQQHFWHQQQ